MNKSNKNPWFYFIQGILWSLAVIVSLIEDGFAFKGYYLLTISCAAFNFIMALVYYFKYKK